MDGLTPQNPRLRRDSQIIYDDSRPHPRHVLWPNPSSQETVRADADDLLVLVSGHELDAKRNGLRTC